jgi:predicted Zn-dependent protease
LKKTVVVFGWCVFAGVIPCYAQVAGRIISLQGRAEIRKVGAVPWVPAANAQVLNTGDTIRTLAQSRAVVLLADETQLKLNANTTLELRFVRQTSNLITRVVQASAAQGDQSILNLGGGQMWLRSKLRPANVRVNTPAVTAAIRGTEFDLRVADDGESTLTMLEGLVDFRNDQGAVLVAPGEQARARIGQAPTKTVLLRPRDAVQWVLYYPGAVSPADYPFLNQSEAQLQATLAAAEARRSAAPADVQNTLLLARVRHDLGRKKESEELLRGALAENPQSAEILTDLAWICLETNRAKEAIELLQKVEPRSDRATVALAMAHYRLGDAQMFFDVIRRADPAGSSLAATQRAFSELMYGNVEEARRLLERIPPSDPQYSLSQGLLSNVMLAQNDKEGALAAAERAVVAAPRSPSAHLNLSLAKQSFFLIPQALESARRALELDPDFVAAQVQVAKLLFAIGDTSRAEQIARAGLARDSSEPALNSLLGFILLAQAKTDESKTYFEKSIAQDNTRGEPHLGLGIAHMRQDKKDEATQAILIASTLEPQISIYQSYLGKAFYDERRFEMAFNALGSASTLDERDPTPHLYSGIFLNDLNRPGAAVRELTRSIELNDNRAVYRSRFLLDEDRATRNVNLATAYNRLYVSEWGNYEALKAQMVDPTNSSTHIFLAQTFLNLRGRTQAAGSEQLLARLLLPVNANSFNAFNDYTTLFEAPQADFTTIGAVGSFDARSGNLISTGGTSRLAYGVNAGSSRTDGFRPVNDDSRSFDAVAQFKLALTPHSDFLFLASHGQANTGDRGQRIINFDNNDTRRLFDRRNRVEFGYHTQFRPGSDAVLYFSAQQLENLINDPEGASFGGQTIGRRSSNRRPDLSFQATHLHDAGPAQFRYGVDIFEGRTRDRRSTYYPPFGDFPAYELVDDPERQKVRYKDAYVHTDYALLPGLVLTGALHYDWSNDNVFGDLTTESFSKWNPQAGLFFTPFEPTALRFAYFRTLQTHFRERLAPTNINGFVLSQNDPALAESTNYHFGWDQRLGSSSFFRGSAFTRERTTPVLVEGDEGFVPGSVANHFHGADFAWNQLLGDQFSLVPQYSVIRAEDTNSIRHQHDISVRGFWISPRGLWVSIGENFIRQGGLLDGRTRLRSSFCTTDFNISYELPRKRGLIFFEATNLFDHRYALIVDPLALDPLVPRRQLATGVRLNF